MLDFLIISTRTTKNGTDIYPNFRTYPKSRDLMIRGGDFHAIWNEELGLWSTNEDDAKQMIDHELKLYMKEHKSEFFNPSVKYMWNSESGSIDRWHKFCQKQMRDSYEMLDQKLIFSNSEINKKDYASKKLSYPLEPGTTAAYDKIMSTLYSDEERHKIEWCIGAIVTGDSKHIQKFMVLYGAAGTGKSTVINIIQQLFDGYYSVFDAKALGTSTNQFALEPFKKNPLVAIQHDADLSKIEDNTRLNSVVSHERMTINEKHAKMYENTFNAFLIMGSNSPVKITDAKSGILRRLIDVSPTGNKLPNKEYNVAMKQIKFELGAIACHCRDVYLEDPHYYDSYIPTEMMGATNDFYNYVIDSYSVFLNDDSTTLKAAWEMYNTYCEDAKVPYPMSRRVFQEELKNYFKEFKERHTLDNGTRVRNYYEGFKTSIFEQPEKKPGVKKSGNQIELVENVVSVFDQECADYFAQYATAKGSPKKKWANVKTKLSSLDTRKLHYVKVPENHIVIDFDIPDKDGNKCLERNLEEASKWPPTYTELSKSGGGVHLHYIYDGDVTQLSRIYDEHIEVKVYTGDSSLRRKLTKCNTLPIATINSGLPLKTKGDKKMINNEVIISEKTLRRRIKKCLNKEYENIPPYTKPNIDFIFKILEDAYNSDVRYDVSDMRNAVLTFAANSTNKSDYCIKLVNKMKFKSEEQSDAWVDGSAPIAFYGIEVFPNLFLVNWKYQGNDAVVRMINPKPAEIESLMEYRLIGFNCRRYDNHILYAAYMGYNNEQLYNLSQKIITEGKGFFGEAYNISYTDVYDFCSKKQSLKKWEIDLGIHHQELGLAWDQPVPEELWDKVAEYCDNDVIATEAVFNARQADFVARQILADLAGGTVNDTTNTLSTKFIFGKNRKPQSQFNYRDMGEVSSDDYVQLGYDDYTRFNDKGQPVFPGYEFEYGKSIYRGEEVGEGGYVYSEPGMYGNVALLDIASMHPSSIVAEELFGPEYTARFNDILNARLAIKHKDFDKARTMLNGALAKYLTNEDAAADLAQALKIVINSVYGLTSARFENPFRDPRNVDNIVAKRGALFMVNLKHEVQKRGFIVAHVKTDSIKIPDATPEIIQFVMDYGKMYGYNFEHEATYDRMCLVNDAVYISKNASAEKCIELYGYAPDANKYNPDKWSATGTQFAVPYLFKTLFSGEQIEFEDMCETKSVAKGTIHIDMNEGYPDLSAEEKELAKINRLIAKELANDDTMPLPQSLLDRKTEIEQMLNDNHNYIFVGRVGSFCPIKPGCGGGELYRADKGSYYSVTGTKGYRWLEAEIVKTLGKEDDIDRSYYENLITEAVNDISQYGDFEWFVSDDPYVGPPYKDGIPVYLDSGGGV